MWKGPATMRPLIFRFRLERPPNHFVNLFSEEESFVTLFSYEGSCGKGEEEDGGVPRDPSIWKGPGLPGVPGLPGLPSCPDSLEI